METAKIFKDLKINNDLLQGKELEVTTPITGEVIAKLDLDTESSYEAKLQSLQSISAKWRKVPAPKRGELVRLFAEELRTNKERLAQLVSLECGKIIEEGRGEVQEMIDICDFALGLSRQLYGLTIASERNEHNMYETYYPLGIVGIISAFNFPVAVWAWNFALATICGNVSIWKPSELTPLCAMACTELFLNAAKKYQAFDEADKIHEIIISDASLGNKMVEDHRVNLVSATGSCRMGNIVGPKVAKRFGKSILELGGNNAIIVTPNANQELALQAILFGAVGTCGQRCTTTRRVFIHKDIYADFSKKLINAYGKLDKKIGNPLDESSLIGPLISETSYDMMQNALKQAKEEGGEVFYGERISMKGLENGYFVKPALVKISKQTDIVLEETFAPILYAMPYDSLEQALLDHNAVEQGLSSAIFTTNIAEAEYFRQNSDCGIANVNIGTSGAEIGGAFGGEKATGGGRESGSDSWKAYMRRQTSTIYYGTETPELAQGIDFSLE